MHWPRHAINPKVTLSSTADKAHSSLAWLRRAPDISTTLLQSTTVSLNFRFTTIHYVLAQRYLSGRIVSPPSGTVTSWHPERSTYLCQPSTRAPEVPHQSPLQGKLHTKAGCTTKAATQPSLKLRDRHWRGGCCRHRRVLQ